MRLAGKSCIVTGGGSGLGRATCLLFAEEGAKVAVADKSREAAESVAREVGEAAIALQTDVSDSENVRAMLKLTVDHFGRLDVLVNNAGYGIPGSVVETDETDWDRLMAVNLNGVFYGCKYAIPIMRKQGSGVIVNTASMTATVGLRDRAAYCASKGAVAALTRAMALDHVAEGIRINCIAPGTMDSPYFDEMLAKSDRPEEMRRELEQRQAMNRMGKPREVAHGILYLACDDSSFATGSMLTVDGGMTAQ